MTSIPSKPALSQSWMKPLFTAEQMAAVDRWAIDEERIPSLWLMENAGLAVTRCVEETVPDGPIAVVCGGGNNGGDGFVVARLLCKAGRDVHILLACDPKLLRGDAKTNYLRALELTQTGLQRLRITAFSADGLREAAGVVDAILGTGFHGKLRGELVEIITAINALDLPTVAVDIPSGVDATTGEVQTVAVKATTTITFASHKLGLWIAPGKKYAGKVEVSDIGIPEKAPVEYSSGLIQREVVNFLPRRSAASNKFSAGTLMVIGGSPGLLSAPAFAAQAAMRCGVGYVMCCVPESLLWLAELKLLEPVKKALPDRFGAIQEASLGPALDLAERSSAVVLGPGIGRDQETAAFLRQFADQLQRPLILDADGLYAFRQEHLKQLAKRSKPTILTPHSGELARIFAVESSEVEKRRLYFAQRAAHDANAIVLLKGDDTLIATPDGALVINSLSAPALATAGTGDILAGVVGACVAGLADPLLATSLAVYLHALAGVEAAQKRGCAESVVASDLLDVLLLFSPE